MGFLNSIFRSGFYKSSINEFNCNSQASDNIKSEDNDQENPQLVKIVVFIA